MTSFYRVIKSIIIFLIEICYAQQPNIVLEQGFIEGLKIFPDSSRTAVYAFLGIPYAQPPVGELRFAQPRPHTGWNGTWQARGMKPICPQLSNTIYDETTEGSLAPPARMDEDCLYLNLWIPETSLRLGDLPVLAIITGEEMSYDWPRNRATGLDLAADGIIVVSIQYRKNIFGWISVESSDLDGNYGLQDQQLALKWIQKNIKKFGGDPMQVTLLGHGTSGAPCALSHALVSREGNNIFSKFIMMSGGNVENILDSKAIVEKTSRVLVQKLGCHFEKMENQQAQCLRTKSVSDLLRAFESIYDHGNGTLSLGPAVSDQWRAVLKNKTRENSFLPLIIGITTNEGAFLQDYWLELAREGYESLRSYVNNTILPLILWKSTKRTSVKNEMIEALNWRYFSGEASHSVPHLLTALQKLLSESLYERPFFNMLQLLTGNNETERSSSDRAAVFAYIFDAPTSLDMRGRVNVFGGTSHTADLPFLLGPSLFQQISRRRFNGEEDKLCRKARNAFINFVKSGNPTPGRIYDAWQPFSRQNNFIYSLGDVATKSEESPNKSSLNMNQIEKLIQRDRTASTPLNRLHRHDYNNPYQLSPVGSTGFDQRRVKASIFGATYNQVNQQDSGYANHLKRLKDFWTLFLPAEAYDNGGFVDSFNEHIRLMEATADAARYKQGFYAMLGLVCALLAILCICVYLLRQDALAVSSSSLSGSYNCCL